MPTMNIIDQIKFSKKPSIPAAAPRETKSKAERPQHKSMNHIRKPRPETMKHFADVLLSAETRGKQEFLPNRHKLGYLTGFSYSTVCALMAHLEYHDIVTVYDRRGTCIKSRAALKRIAETGELPSN